MGAVEIVMVLPYSDINIAEITQFELFTANDQQ
jgi:hypothetical protein